MCRIDEDVLTASQVCELVLVYHTALEPERSPTHGLCQAGNRNRQAGAHSQACLCLRVPLLARLYTMPFAYLHTNIAKLADQAIRWR